MNDLLPATRRSLLLGGVALGGAFIVPALIGTTCASSETVASGGFQPNAFLRIDGDGITLYLPKTEMGQGINTTIAMLVAEELEVAPETIRIALPPGIEGAFGDVGQETGGSSSVRETWEPLRLAGATARTALVAAAAGRWGVPIDSCVARDGIVTHTGSARALDYGALAPLAARRPIPENVALKPRSAFRIIGKDRRRIDADQKARGAVEYGIDVRLPGMLVATLAQAPAIGGELTGIDRKAALAIPGVRHVIAGKDVLFVVADHYWAAKRGLDAATPKWSVGTRPNLDQAKVEAQLAAASNLAGSEAAEVGDVDAAMQGAVTVVRAEYSQPFLAHAPMEPGNCVIHVANGACEIWTGTQVPASARKIAAKALDIDIARVTVHNRLMGGGFGRRLETDMIKRAVELGRQINVPVKLIWSREEDMQHDMYRPAYHDRLEAGFNAAGTIVAWRHRIAGSSILARLAPDRFKGVDRDAVEGAVETPYTLPARRISFERVESGLATSWWRGVGGLRSAFAVECFIDELAHARGQDPVAFRRSLITDERARRVLDLAAEKAGWGKPFAKGTGLGIALIHLWNTYLAAVAEVTIPPDGEPRVTRVVTAVDCGQQINPLGIRAQVESGVNFALSATLFGRITLSEGRVEQSNFSDYRVLRIHEAPVIETHLIDSVEAPGGMGEPPAAVTGPAVMNALFAAGGKRLRAIPVV